MILNVLRTFMLFSNVLARNLDEKSKIKNSIFWKKNVKNFDIFPKFKNSTIEKHFSAASIKYMLQTNIYALQKTSWNLREKSFECRKNQHILLPKILYQLNAGGILKIYKDFWRNVMCNMMFITYTSNIPTFIELYLIFIEN